MQMNNEIFRVNGFTYEQAGGNPAGIVLSADNLDESKMLEIAKEIGYSETAFLMESKNADYKIRYFTPLHEVDLCGHATVAAFNLLRDINKLTLGKYLIETKAGILQVIVNEYCVYMEQKTPKFYQVLAPDEIANCFARFDKTVLSDMPMQIVSTGLKDIIVKVNSLDDLLGLSPIFPMITKISKQKDVIGMHVFCIENSEVYTRNFAPLYGINEESATGTANGALACYIVENTGIIKDTTFTMKQGMNMNSLSEIVVKIGISAGQINTVFVGGSGTSKML